MTGLENESVLGKFRAHLWDYRRLVLWLLGLGTLPPIVGAIGKIGPPWPTCEVSAYIRH